MDDNNDAKYCVPGHRQPASTLRNLVFGAMVLTGLAVIGHGWAVLLEVYRNLGGTVLAWLVCGLLLLIGVFVLWGSLHALKWWDVLKRSPGRGELVAIIVVMVAAGGFAGALGSSLDWQL